MLGQFWSVEIQARLANFNIYNLETRYPISGPLTVPETEVDEAISTVQDLIAAIVLLI
jgi:hypothetical protein